MFKKTPKNNLKRHVWAVHCDFWSSKGNIGDFNAFLGDFSELLGVRSKLLGWEHQNHLRNQLKTIKRSHMLKWIRIKSKLKWKSRFSQKSFYDLFFHQGILKKQWGILLDTKNEFWRDFVAKSLHFGQSEIPKSLEIRQNHVKLPFLQKVGFLRSITEA